MKERASVTYLVPGLVAIGLVLLHVAGKGPQPVGPEAPAVERPAGKADGAAPKDALSDEERRAEWRRIQEPSVMDTSGSMGDEALALCAGIDQVITDLADADIVVNATLLGITETPGDLFACLSNDVVTRFGGQVTSACDDGNPCTPNDSCNKGYCNNQ